ncbi:MAG: PTS sugar transporter subunit IIC [Bulleidia sp.]
MKDKFMNGLLALAGKMQSNKVLSAIKDSFIDNMPVVIFGAFTTLFQYVLCQTGGVTNPKTGELIYYVSLGNVPGFGWLTKLTPIFSTANYGCMNFMAVAICILVAIHYGENLGLAKDNTLPMVALASFITLVDTSASGTMTGAALTAANPDVAMTIAEDASVSVKLGSVVSSNYTSSNGLFVGIVVGILATLLYVKLIQSGKLTLKLPDSVPPNVSRSFSVLFPACITILVVAIVGFIFTSLGMNIFSVINMIMSPIKKIVTGLPGYLVCVFLMILLWWFGIHGANVVGSVTTPFMTSMMAENLALYQAGTAVSASGVFYTAEAKAAGYSIIATPFGSTFYSSTGSGITGGLIIAIMLFSKRDDFKAIAKLAIPCGLFNINEPIIFGIPMVMNPILGIPFFLAPLLCVTLGYVVTVVGLCPLMVIDAPWTTPVGLLGFLASSGNIMGGVWQLVIILGGSTLVYAPFVIACNKQAAAA